MKIKCFICESVDTTPKGKFCLGKTKIGSSKESSLELLLSQCKNCGFVFVSSLPNDKEVENYYKSNVFWQSKMSTSINNEFSSWSELFQKNPSLHERQRRAMRQFNYIARYNNFEDKTLSILDAGAGFSPFLYICKKNNFNNLYAIEPSQQICDFLQKQGVTLIANTFEEWFSQSEHKKFDIIIVSHTLEHLKDPGNFLSHVRKFLSPNGMLYIEVPHRDDRQAIHGGLHFQFFDVSTLKRSLEKYDFKVIDIRNLKYNFLGMIFRKILLFYYIVSGFIHNKINPKKGYSIQTSFFSLMYYNIWSPLIKILNIELYIYISSDDIVSISSLNKN